MPTTFPKALELNSSLDSVDLGSASGLDNLSTWTAGFLLRFDGATGGLVLSKRTPGAGGGWWIIVQPTGRVDCYYSRAVDEASGLFNSAIPTDNSWTWVWVRCDRGSGSQVFTVRSGPYGGALSNISVSGNNVGSGAFADDSAEVMTLGFDSSSGTGRTAAYACLAFFNSVLSDGTIDSYSADFEAAGAAASLDFIKWDASMDDEATSGNGVFTGTYVSTPVLIDGPDIGGATVVPPALINASRVNNSRVNRGRGRTYSRR